MTQPAASVNDAEAFLSGFSGKHFIRLLHDGYDPETQQPERLRPRQFYGDLGQSLIWLRNVAVSLNDGSGPDYRFNVFYAAGDPLQGKHAKQDDVASLRVVYQDCDRPEFADILQLIDGQPPHAIIETSPGKRQRIWHINETPAFRHRAIHDHMVQRHSHDSSTHGPHRLLRLPGFRNWKYDDGPVSHILELNPELPRISEERLFKHFGFHHHDREKGPIEKAMQNGQRSGDLPDGKLYDIKKERAKRSGSLNHDEEDAARHRDAHDLAPEQILTDVVLNALSLLDPDIGRNDWRRVLAALHFMAGEREWGKQLAEAWSMLAPSRFDQAGFEKHWSGLSREVKNPASWLTILRITAPLRHDKATRALRNSELFKRFEEEQGPVLDYETREIVYPVQMKTETPDGPQWRPDPRARRNVEYLLDLEGIRVFYDEFFQTHMASVCEAAPMEIDQKLLMEVYSTAHATGLRIDDSFLSKQMEAIALDTKHDPVRLYLRDLPPWDGVERLSTAFQRHMGAPDTPSVREVLTLVMVGIVKRTFKPGYKFDLMPIMEGKQELGKSSFFRILMPDADWYGEGPKMNEEPKRLLSQLTGKLIIEFAELAGMRKIDIDSVKKLITQQTDEFIANYARKKTKALRRCIFVGSVNGTQYLRDLTDNRRFPVIPVTKELNYDALRRERDQLWAEAMFMEPFMDELRFSSEANADMKELQEARLDINSETSAIIGEVRQFETGFMTVETIWDRIGIPFNERSKRIGHAQYLFREIKDLLERDGWVWNGVMKHEGKSIRAIYKKVARGTPPEIICNGGALVKTDDIDIEELLK